MFQIFMYSIRTVLFTLLMVASSVINADSLETLLMPGPVINAHEEYEQDCNQCHDKLNKDKQSQLCLQCHAHENILDDLSNETGFHGRLSRQASNNCKHCHTEHEGRNAKVVLLNPSTFDHQQTDFNLKHSHKKTPCKACHKKDEKYSEAPGECYGCHKESDVHKGEHGKKCEDCHKATSWKKAEFDHDETDFPLKGEHDKTGCNSCHINKKYKDTPKNCINCHRINDVHGGDFGQECDACHNSKKWQDVLFDHNKKTDFPLKGKHKKASCDSCHKSRDVRSKESRKKLPKQCYGCHKNDDSHKGQYGKKCKTCHTSESWQKQKFDHSEKTDFPLKGKHKKVECTQCHKDNLYKEKTGDRKKTVTRCIACHKTDDVHNGEQGETCNNCHNEKGWRNNVRFDHDLSSFPLIGMHATTQCEECHLSSEYGETESDCNACHADDDEHKTRLGTNCEACHNPNAWNIWLFDHDKDTDFTIDGAHKELGCHDCHQTPSKEKVKASRDCISCHRSSDVHDRQFGRQCGHCHSTESFTDINVKQLR